VKATVGIALLLIVLLLALGYWIQRNGIATSVVSNATTTETQNSTTNVTSGGVTLQETLSNKTLSSGNFTFLPSSQQWQYFVYLPQNYSSSNTYPMIIGMHGQGGYALGYLDDWIGAANTYNFILAFPQSNTSEGWWTGTASDFAIAIIKEMKSNYKIGNVFLTGCSAGAKVTYSDALWNPNTFKGIAPMASSFGTYTPDKQDLSNAKGQNFYIVQGAEDSEIPLSNTQYAVSTLKGAGAHVTFIVVQGMGHACPIAEDMNITKWFASLEPRA